MDKALRNKLAQLSIEAVGGYVMSTCLITSPMVIAEAGRSAIITVNCILVAITIIVWGLKCRGMIKEEQVWGMRGENTLAKSVMATARYGGIMAEAYVVDAQQGKVNDKVSSRNHVQGEASDTNENQDPGLPQAQLVRST